MSLVLFELHYHLRQLPFYFCIICSFSLGFAFSHLSGYEDSHLNANSPHNTLTGMSLLTLAIPFVLAIIANNSFLRDRDYNVSELIFSFPTKPYHLLSSRLFSVLIVSLIIYTAAPIGMICDILIFNDARRIANIEVHHYLWVLIVVVIPTLIVIGSIVFASSILLSSVIINYCIAATLYFGFFLAATYANLPIMAGSIDAGESTRAIVSIADPFGLSAIFYQVSNWSIEEKNTQLFSLNAQYLFNRTIWLLISVALTLYLLHRPNKSFELGDTVSGKDKNKKIETKGIPLLRYLHNSSLLRPPGRHFRFKSTLLNLFLFECRTLFKSWPFYALILIWIIFIVAEMLAILPHTLPTTSVLLWRYQYDMLPLFGLFVVIIFSAESIWRERQLKVDPLVNTSPTSKEILLFSKTLSIAVIPIIIVLASVISSIIFQLANQYYDIDITLYLSLFYHGALPLVLSVPIAIFFHISYSNKYASIVISSIFFVTFSVTGTTVLGLEHPIWQFIPNHNIYYSDLAAYGRSGTGFALKTVTYAFISASFLFASLCLHGSSRFRTTIIRPLLGSSVLLTIISFLLQFYITENSLQYESQEARNTWSTEYERRYRTFKNKVQPIITAVYTELDLFPQQRKLSIKGHYILKNTRQVAISEILIGVNRTLEVSKLVLETATEVNRDPRLQHWLFKLENKLEPGQEIKLLFSVSQTQTGLVPSPRQASVVKNGTFVIDASLMPIVGYEPKLEIKNYLLRKKMGLSPLVEYQPIEERVKHQDHPQNQRYPFINFETKISTAQNQVAISQGELVSMKSERKRNIFHYKSQSPIANIITYASANYQVQTEHHFGVDIEIYYYDAHINNLPQIFEAARDTLHYMEENFGPYQLPYLRLVEVPSYTGIGGLAAAGLITLGENRVFRHNSQKEAINEAYRITSHEVAHQWWGHQLMSANNKAARYEGAEVLSETLAMDTQTQVLKLKYGNKMVERYLGQQKKNYQQGKSADWQEEMPLYRARHAQEYIYYSKGVLVMNELREKLGNQQVNLALHSFLSKYKYPYKRPTTIDLINELHRVADSDSLQLIDTLFKNTAEK